MDKNRYDGRRVRLKGDANYGRRAATYLTDEQLEHGPQGVVIRSEVEGGALFLYVDLENVPGECRVPAEEVELI